MNKELSVIIKEKDFTYQSDYPEGWVFAKGDSFKKVKIGKFSCFIKRFEAKTPENISGWNLMNLLKGKNESNLARIYDIVGTKENGKNIFYVFYEFIEGETLNHLVSKHTYVDLDRLTENLFSAINSLHKKQYWFPDFIEKNIFCPKMGGYVLIDLDSVHPVANLPDNDMWADKEYWALVFSFYKSALDKKHLTYSDVNGISLNYLIVVFMVLRLKIYQSDLGKEYGELFNDLPQYLNNISFSISSIFARLYQNSEPVTAEDIYTIKDFIKSKIITLSTEQVQLLINGNQLEVADEPIDENISTEIEPDPEPDPEYGYEPELPVISRFESNAIFIEKGKQFNLHWEVKNASNIRIFRNEVLISEPDTAKGDIILTEPYDGVDKEVEFRLSAANFDGDTESKPITIFIKESVIIEDFHEKEKKSVFNKMQLSLLIFVGILLAGFATFKYFMPAEKNKVVVVSGFQPTTVRESYIMIITGENFPAASNGLKVLFNGTEGHINSNSENLISVVVPHLNVPNDAMVTVTVVADGESIHASKKLVVKKS